MISGNRINGKTICCKALMSIFASLCVIGCTTKTPAPINQAKSVNNASSLEYKNQGNSVGGGNYSDNSTGWSSEAPDIVVKNKEINTSVKLNTKNSKNESDSQILARNYSEIPKGSFSGQYYTVSKGDTLFYIAWVSGNDFRTLAEKNNINEPYHLTVGQILDVSGGTLSFGNINSVANKINTPNNLPVTDSSTNNNVGKVLQNSPTSPVNTPTEVKRVISNSMPAKIVWRWPAEGKIIDGFSPVEGGNKGLDIAGSRGQSILSAADGKVVYAGNALRGYGNLIIIKHDDDYLSAYAHNDTMLVSEQQDVKAGQKIATMGSTGASSVRLHFEVRYKGKSVNPLQYLPQR